MYNYIDRLSHWLCSQFPTKKDNIMSCSSIDQIIEVTRQYGDETHLYSLQNVLADAIKSNKYIDDLDVDVYDDSIPLPANNLPNRDISNIDFRFVNESLYYFEKRFQLNTQDNESNINNVCWLSMPYRKSEKYNLYSNIINNYDNIIRSDELRKLSNIHQILLETYNCEGHLHNSAVMNKVMERISTIIGIINSVTENNKNN